jgi:hypothetical protein
MEQSSYPFPLAVHSSHHSHYHRFLLGAEPAVLAPFPKPYCLGRMAQDLGGLAGILNLPRWRKLYHGAMPWVGGFGAAHYEVGAVPPHRPLPPEYARPPRRYGAYDFVQIADPAVSALALVAGDRRVLERFIRLSDEFTGAIEPAACARSAGPAGTRGTGRIVAGQFAEPTNRWLMPFLHVHSRILNLTSFAAEPRRLACLDPEPLARAAQREMRRWVARQAEALSDLGYTVRIRGTRAPALSVNGVPEKLLAATEAPRIAVLRLLQRLIGGGGPASGALGTELPTAAIAAMAGQLEALIARSLTFYKPPKLGIPAAGPWHRAVRDHLACHCPDGLAMIEAAARRAQAAPSGATLFPAPPGDAAHVHGAQVDALAAPAQAPSDPELGHDRGAVEPERAASAWLAREFATDLTEVNERVVRSGPADSLASYREVLAEIDQLAEGPDLGQLEDARNLLGTELDRREGLSPAAPAGRALALRAPLQSIDELFEAAAFRLDRAPEIGGRSL